MKDYFKMTFGELAERFGMGEAEEKIGINGYALAEGLATKEDTIDITQDKAEKLGISKYEFKSRCSN